MKKWNLIIDIAECTNCNNCFLACKDEYVGNNFDGYSAPQPLHGHKWINILANERGQFPIMDIAYVPTMCNHCDDAPCIKQGKGAVKKRDDGIVIIDPKKAIDRKDIVESCPYGAIWWNEDLSLPQAWTFDAHLLDQGWEQPRCAQSCPTGAMKAVKASDDELAMLIEQDNLEPLRPDLNTKPRVLYKNLHLYSSIFIAGEVVGMADDVIDCVTNAKVLLSTKDKQLVSTHTDAFGEFKFDGLKPDRTDYSLTITHEKFSTKTVNFKVMENCVVFDEIMLEAKP
ncbi:MAG: oxidoreductase [Hyphomicrobiales bacterium]|nr:oxidoreductase [Hyphomicrobiales bacterium]